MSKGLFSSLNAKNVSIAVILGYGTILVISFLASVFFKQVAPTFQKLTGGVYIFIIIGALLVLFGLIRQEFDLTRTSMFVFLLTTIGVIALVILTRKIFPAPFEGSILSIAEMLPDTVQSLIGVS